MYSSLRNKVLNPELFAGQVHICSASLDQAQDEFRSLKELLSEDEIMRAERFHFEKEMRRYIICRGLLRKLLGSYLDVEPEQIRFCYGKYGKPALADTFGKGTISFNLSHSDDLALYAFTRNREIGIDIERIRVIPDMEQIIERIFSAPEKAVFHALPEGRKKTAFFQYWTRKEALLKAAGNGLYHPLDSIDVSLSPSESYRFLNIEGHSTGAANWQIQDLSSASGFAAAYAVERPS